MKVPKNTANRFNSLVFLLSQLATRGPYTRPTGRYINLPVAFSANGWIVTLSAPAIAMWLITKEMQGGTKSPDQVWVSPALAKGRYHVSEDTRAKGYCKPKEHLLLMIGRTKQGDEWTWDRLRNTYWLNLSRLDDEPVSPISP